MKETIILFLKGIIIGTGKIIPGVSGGMLAMTLKVYDKGIDAISNYFKDVKSNTLFLAKVGLGILVSILLFSKIINFSLNNFYLPTMLLFIGLIIGGIPGIYDEVKDEKSLSNFNIMLIPIVFVLLFSIINKIFEVKIVSNASLTMLILMGILDAITMIIPGISGTAILMILGYYNMIIESFSSLTSLSLLSYNLSILIPFCIGLVIGVISLVKIINFILNKYRTKSYYAILGFSISSIFLLFSNTFNTSYSLGEIIVSIFLLTIGFFISRKFDKLN